MISRLCARARLTARTSFAKPFEGYCFDYGTLYAQYLTDPQFVENYYFFCPTFIADISMKMTIPQPENFNTQISTLCFEARKKVVD